MVLDLTPNDFASDWQSRPVCNVEIGLRLPSEDDVQTARCQADQRLQQLELRDAESATRAWNDALMAFAVARCICDPRDVTQESPVLQLAEDTISVALTSAAIRRLFDAVERLMVEQSPLAPEATDDELAALAARILSGEVAQLTSAKNFRRFARYCLDMLPETD
jgi:hypothetical protein